MSDEILEEQIKEEEKIDGEVANPMTEEEKIVAEKDAEYRKQISILVKKVFDENFANSDLPYAYLEIIPDYFKAMVSIIKGRSKKWEEIKKVEDEFYMTPVNQLELYEENIEENKDLDSQGII